MAGQQVASSAAIPSGSPPRGEPGHFLFNKNGGPALPAFFNFVKTLFGAGVLTTPHLYMMVGVWTGLPLYAMVGGLCLVWQIFLLAAKHEIERRSTARPCTFPELAGSALGLRARQFLDAVNATLSLCFITGFVVVILENMAAQFPGVPRWLVTVCLLPMLGFLDNIKALKDMWITSMLGVLVYVVGIIGVVLVSSIWRLAEHSDQDQGVAPAEVVTIGGVLGFIGSSTYGIEGIATVVTTEMSLKDRAQGQAVVGFGMALYVTLAMLFGSIGYAAGYGDNDTVTESMPPGILTEVIRVALIIALIFTHPATLFPAAEIIERSLLGIDDYNSGDDSASASGSETSSCSGGSCGSSKRPPVGQRQPLLAIQQPGPSEAGEDQLAVGADKSVEAVEAEGTPGTPSMWEHHLDVSGAADPVEDTATTKPSTLQLVMRQLCCGVDSTEQKRRVSRTFLMLLTTILGASISNFTDFSGVVGNLFMSIVGFVIPAAITLAVFTRSPKDWPCVNGTSGNEGPPAELVVDSVKVVDDAEAASLEAAEKPSGASTGLLIFCWVSIFYGVFVTVVGSYTSIAGLF